MKKQIVIVFALLIGLSVFTGCSKKEPAKADNSPGMPINFIVFYAAGGGTDLGAWLLLPYIE